MKARPPLGRLRPLVPHAARRAAMRPRRGLALVWRARGRRRQRGVGLLQAVSTVLVRSFPLSLALSWSATPRPNSKTPPGPAILHRGRLRPPPIAFAGRFERLVERLSERTHMLTRREAEMIMRLHDLVTVERRSPAMRVLLSVPTPPARGSGSADSQVDTPKRTRRQLPGISTPAPVRTPWTRRPAETATPPRRAPRSAESRIAPSASVVPPRGLEFRRTARGGTAPRLVQPMPKARPEPARAIRLLRQPRRASAERATGRPAVDLVWTRAAVAETIWSRADEPVAPAQPAATAPMPQAWPASPMSRAAAAASSPAAMPDINRLVDEVVRRLERLARDERMRRGI